MIETTLNRQQAEALFAENAVVMSGKDVIYDYKIAELFGRECCVWAEACMRDGGYLDDDYSAFGSVHCMFFFKSGFNKLVSWHNDRISSAEYKASAGGQIWDELWTARRARLAALDAEEERKREERKAKRAEARRAKQAAAEQAASA